MIDSAVAIPTDQDRMFLEALPCFVFLQRGSEFVYANRLAREALSAREGDVFAVGKIFEDRFPGLIFAQANSREAQAGNVLGSANHPYTTDFESRLQLPDGSSLPVRGSCRVLEMSPEPLLLVTAMRWRQEETPSMQSNFLEQLLNAAPEAIMITRGARILHVNHEFERLFGFSADEAVGRNSFDILLPETRRHEFDMLDHAVRIYGRASMETVRLNKSGDLLDVSVLVAPIELSGVEVGYFVSYRDISEKKRNDAKLQHDALHDALTGLANRTLFLDRLQTTMARQQRRAELRFAVMFLDLDRFKGINDSLGHAAGDALLKEVAARLRTCFRPEDTVARFGGDEFAVLIEDVPSSSNVSGITDRVQREIHLPIEIYGQEIVVSASIGIAFGTSDHAAAEQVLRDADYAMYRAKSRGQARHEVFDNSMHVHIAHEVERERDLRDAFEKGELEVEYQPIYRLENGEIEGFEALLRRRGKDGGMHPFGDFLPLAEDSGLILPIGFFVLEEAAKRLRDWAQTVPAREPRISVNLSPRQFKYPGLLERIAEIQAQTKIPAGRLRLEIAENAVNQDPGYAASMLERVVEMGLSVALDNFGAGLASMNHLVRLPIDLVKIDRRLLASLPVPGRQAAILQTIFDLGRLLEVRMLAEGIERREQLEALRTFGCDLVQGHLFSPAVSSGKAEELLRRGAWPAFEL